MKQYWKLIALTTIIILTLGVHFFQAQYISSSFAQYEIEIVEGDETYVEPVTIVGHMYTSFYSSEAFKLTHKGTDFLIDKSLPEMLSFHDPGKMVTLQEKYRSFMRDKEKHIERYDEDDTGVAYATIPHTRWGIQQNELEIAILDKTTKRTQKFTSPLIEEYSFMSISGVKLHDETVSVITLNEKYGGNGVAEYLAYHVYTFNRESEALVDETIIPLEADENKIMTYGVLMHGKSTPDEIVTSEIQMKLIEKSSGVDVNTARTNTAMEVEESYETTRLQSYNLQTQQVKEIPLPENAGVPIRYNGKEVVFAQMDDRNLLLTRYHIEEKQLSEPIVIELKEHSLDVWEIESGIVQDDLFYLHSLSSTGFEYKSLPTVLVIDLNTLEVKYRGQVVNKMPDNLGSHYEVQFQKLELIN